ncbi:potassium channel family protein [Candidatus Neomarinimicrobiota bacterium]
MVESIKRFFLRHPLVRVFAIILLVAMVGGAGVFLLEQRAGGARIRNVGEALWWAIVTMTTVGYGDFTPLALPGRILAVIIMFAGISLMAVLSGTVASQLVARRLRANQGLMAIKVKDHVIICGWHHKVESVLGALLSLAEGQEEFQVILINEEHEDRMQSLKNQYGYTRLKYIRGEFTREATLRQAQLEFARAVIVMPVESPTGGTNDEKTILASLTIKNLNPKVHLIAYVHDKYSLAHVKRAKVDDVVLADNFSSFIAASHILEPGIPQTVEELMESSSPHRFQRVSIPKEFVGRPFEELLLHNKKKHGWLTVGLFHEEEQTSFSDFLSSDASQLDAFIERKLREAGHGMGEGSRISVNVNPSQDHMIDEGSGAIIIP